MFMSLLTLKSASLSLVLGALVLAGSTEARTLQGHDHGGHDGGSHADTDKQKSVGDPYTLATDPVSGKKLGAIDKQVIVDHEGRELRFSSKQNADKFKAKPGKYLAAVDEKMIEQQLAYYPLNTCIISGEELGGMGETLDVIHNNRLVRLCCKGCVKKLAKDPAGVFAKLDKAVIEQQGKTYAATTCPVSGEKLGGMGDPIDVVMGNRLTRLCCKGCVKKFRRDPVAYLAKVKAPKAGKGGHGGEKGHGDHGGKGHGGHNH